MREDGGFVWQCGCWASALFCVVWSGAADCFQERFYCCAVVVFVVVLCSYKFYFLLPPNQRYCFAFCSFYLPLYFPAQHSGKPTAATEKRRGERTVRLPVRSGSEKLRLAPCLRRLLCVPPEVGFIEENLILNSTRSFPNHSVCLLKCPQKLFVSIMGKN